MVCYDVVDCSAGYETKANGSKAQRLRSSVLNQKRSSSVPTTVEVLDKFLTRVESKPLALRHFKPSVLYTVIASGTTVVNRKGCGMVYTYRSVLRPTVVRFEPVYTPRGPLEETGGAREEGSNDAPAHCRA
ncbi:hypothetical protein EVAR_43917_1 [Eumeta japonica]|uniref:Uncharacterized protein n=1 Tax=Eumeta variegata TaxID=151549 RepID=A0A4C1WMN3_EUMVA|nr:hypothetical protein EVAR_43917_1 [Eumeta japonica]